MKEVFICAPQRTAIGSIGGVLASLTAPELGAEVFSAVLRRANISGELVQGVIMGCVLQAGIGQAPARQAAIKAGLPVTVQALTINKVCSSGLKAVMLAANEIQVGNAEAIIAGGMENMSQAPYLLPALRNGARLGHVQALDSVIQDGLWDPYNNFHMGSAAEICVSKYKLTREAQDQFAIESYQRALTAIEKGYFVDEIVPVKIKKGKEVVEVQIDEEPGRVKFDKISQLKPVFDTAGTVTAANASSLNDGAAAMLVCSAEFVKKHQLKPSVKIIAQSWFGKDPAWFTTAPVDAVQSLLKKANKSVAEIDLFEINEAFSAVALACATDLKIPSDKLNISGGAVALGHPIGASGARILTTLIYGLQRLNKKLGVASLCNGGGEATAMLVEAV